MSSERDLAVQLLELRLNTALDKGIDTQSRVIQVVGEIDSNMFRHIDAGLTLLEEGSRKAITLRLNSEGGYPSDALAIVGRIKASSCQIIIEAYGQVSSAATIILASGKKRRMSEYCLFMTHQSSYEVGGSHVEIKDAVDQAEQEEKIWASHMGRFTGTDAEFWYELHKTGKNKYFNATECLNMGIVDEIF